MEMKRERDLKLFSVFTGIFVAALVLVPSLGSKFIAVGPFNLNGATLIFPITFIFNDILTEVYGYTRSRRIIWVGLACQVLAAFFYWLIEIWPAAPFWHSQEAFSAILGMAPRITLASLTAYFCGEFANSVVLSKMKYVEKGERGWWQAWRFVASTIVGEGFDSVVFMTVGFLGVLSLADIGITIVTIWIAKIIYEVVALPVSMRVANWVKSVEGVDEIDDPRFTSYNPFAIFFPAKNGGGEANQSKK